MNSLSDVQKKRILKFLEKASKDLNALKKKEALEGKEIDIDELKEHADLLRYFRRFVSPRKLTGKIVDKLKNKFYYETEYFIGDVIGRQERYNKEILSRLQQMEREINKIKKSLKD
ncbi:hypothetical protein ACFL3C_01040 [Patescibacteria group bacterium]